MVQVYVSPNSTSISARSPSYFPDADPLAIKRLVAFQRVFVPAGGSVDIPFSFPVDSLASVDGQGDKVVWAGEYKLLATRGGDPELVWDVGVQVLGNGGKFVVRKYPHPQTPAS